MPKLFNDKQLFEKWFSGLDWKLAKVSNKQKKTNSAITAQQALTEVSKKIMK